MQIYKLSLLLVVLLLTTACEKDDKEEDKHTVYGLFTGNFKGNDWEAKTDAGWEIDQLGGYAHVYSNLENYSVSTGFTADIPYDFNGTTYTLFLNFCPMQVGHCTIGWNGVHTREDANQTYIFARKTQQAKESPDNKWTNIITYYIPSKSPIDVNVVSVKEQASPAPNPFHIEGSFCGIYYNEQDPNDSIIVNNGNFIVY